MSAGWTTDRSSVLQPNGKFAGVSGIGKKVDIIDCILHGKTESIFIILGSVRFIHTESTGLVTNVGIDIIGVNTVAAFGHSLIESRKHDVAYIRRPCVQPPLTRPAIERFPPIACFEFALIRSVILIAPCGEVANHFTTLGMQVRYCGGSVGE